MAKENHLSYKVTKDGAAKIERLRQKFIELDDLIDEVTQANGQTPADQIATSAAASGRARALSKTALEDARMWAVVSVVRANNTGPADQGTVSGSEKAAA